MQVFSELEFFGRLLLAGICGAAVGYERKRNMKEAGVRTHFIVALAASLVMLISKYGFSDVAALPGHSVDTSRIASSIVSGVGFLGAGMIFIRKNTINGLTTAAGIWATSAIGMAIGGGMYFLGIMTTAILLIVQFSLQKYKFLLHIPACRQLHFVTLNEEDVLIQIREVLSRHGAEITNVKMEIGADGTLTIDLLTKLPEKLNALEIAALFYENAGILKIEL